MKTDAVKITIPKTVRARKKRVGAYLFGRRFYLIVFAAIYAAGLFVGAVVLNNLDAAGKIELQSAAAAFHENAAASEIVARLFWSAAMSAVLIFAMFLAGLTIFAPVAAALISIFKGIMCAYSAGIYTGEILGTAGVFAAGTILFFGTAAAIFFIMASAESLCFSVFMIKNEEGYRASLSFANISLYVSRMLIFFACAILLSVAETLVVSLVFAIL